jgi:3-oxo-5-alpha-steroid 4-dehydrogenase 1
VRIDRFLFKYVSNPNYLGEIIEWIGYSLVSGHLYAALFAFSTLNVLLPAGMVRSRWNVENIEGYPRERKAVFPLLL